MELTKYEKARIVGARALQLAMGAPMFVKLSQKEFEAIRYSPIEIAKKELEKDLIPITVRRPLPEKIEKEVIPVGEELPEEDIEDLEEDTKEEEIEATEE